MKKTGLSLVCCLFTTLLFAQLYYTNKASNWGVSHTYLSPRSGGGISCFDFDNDGWDDLTMATADGETIHFYKNMNGSFLRLPDLVPTTEEAKQILWVDFDNDGDQDLFVASFNGINRLYQQTAPLVFTDITTAAGLPNFYTDTYGACFGDYDRDGWLDLYFSVRLLPAQGGSLHVLYHNNGDGTFSDVSTDSNTSDVGRRPFCSSFIDYNNDMWPDIYTAHDRSFNPNTLLENQGDGTFVDKGEA
ncbi:MAG: VCBS repeat-containing protein, partial [Bacteroidota bacterium]